MRVAIIGAGITGLALQDHLARRGVESVVVEAATEPGGVVRTDRIGDRLVERGPQRTRLTPAVFDLVSAAGLEDQVVGATEAPIYLYRDGRFRRIPRTIRGAIVTDLLSFRGKLRALAEPLAGPPSAGETVQAYLCRAFGREVAATIGPLYGGLYGTHPDDMLVDRTLGRALAEAGIDGSVVLAALRRRLRRRAPTPVATFDEGMGALPRALYERHRDSIRLGTAARSIDAADGGYRIATDGGNVQADHVVVTTEAAVAAALLAEVDPASARCLGRLTYNPLAVVTLHADADLHGAGYVVPFDEPLDTLGSTWGDCLFGREGSYTCYLGGAKAPALLSRSDDRLGTIAAEEFEAVTGYAARAVDVHRLRPGMPAFDRSWVALDGVDLPAGLHLCTNYTARAGIPGRVAAAERLASTLAAEAGV